MLSQAISDWPVHELRPPNAPKPLEGVRVVDFSHFAAGPLATMILADMGADVIKVEPPGRGEDFRHYPPMHPLLPNHSAPYHWANRNKRSVALDLKTDAGQRVARELVARADVLVENFSAGVMERFGLHYDACRKLNASLIYCSISAYGREGQFADRLGFDPVAQAECGLIATTGYPDREGTRTLAPIVDIGTAMMASNAILGALMSRTKTGKGQAVEVTLFETGVLLSGYAAMQYLFSGQEPQRNGNTSPDTSPSGVFKSQDKSFYLNCGNDRIFNRLAIQVLGRPDLASDAVLSQRKGRLERRPELFSLLQEIFSAKPWSHWKELMRAAAIPCGEVRTIGEALLSPEARERNLLTRVHHSEAGWLPNIRLPIRYSETPMADPHPAPTVGQDTIQVMTDVLALDVEKIEDLKRRGAFGSVDKDQARSDAKREK